MQQPDPRSMRKKLTEEEKVKAGLIKTPLKVLRQHFNYYYMFEGACINTKQKVQAENLRK